MGARVRAFEEEFAEFHGVRHAVMVNSGSSANLLAVAAAVLNPDVDLNPGDEVIVPAVSWSTTYYPLHQYGLVMRFVDIDEATLNLDLAQVERAIGPRTKAIMAVNLLGNPLDYARLTELAKAHGLVIIEDNCESLGARFDGRLAGTFGFLGTFSTFFSHHMSTMEGGLIVTDDERTAQTLQSIRAHGWLRGLPEDSKLREGDTDEFLELFRFVLPGYNVRPLEMEGALGSEQLRKLPGLVSGRRENAKAFVELFRDFDGADIQSETGESSWFGFAMLLKGPLAGRRAEVVARLNARGAECRPIVAGNFTRNPVMKHLNAVVDSALPAADRIDAEGFFVGNHHYDVVDQLTRLREELGVLAGE